MERQPLHKCLGVRLSRVRRSSVKGRELRSHLVSLLRVERTRARNHLSRMSVGW